MCNFGVRSRFLDVIYGVHTIDPYSSTERTNDIYAVLLQGSGQCLRFRFRKANVQFAFLVILMR